MEAKIVNYTIYQLPINHPRKFRSIRPGDAFDLGDYCAVWRSSGYHLEEGMTYLDICEELFTKFNMMRPEHYAGTSLSVSDVIAIEDQDDINLYYCNNLGFQEIIPKNS